MLVGQIREHFQPKKGDILLDATLGMGGHAKMFLDASPDTRVIGIEADAKALESAKELLAEYGDRVRYILGTYARLEDLLQEVGIASVTHVLFDLGIGSHQLEDSSRGFSFAGGEGLSMRFGSFENLPPSSLDAVKALERRIGYPPDVEDLISHLSQRDLAFLIRTYGEERYASRIARGIQEAGATSAKELTEAIARVVPSVYRKGKIHPATRTFQALRLAVNRELESLEAALPQALKMLAPDGLLAVISFHSLEDRIVKQYFRREARDCICPPTQIECICGHKAQLTLLTKKPIRPKEEEIMDNPRARSAKLRIARKL